MTYGIFGGIKIGTLATNTLDALQLFIGQNLLGGNEFVSACYLPRAIASASFSIKSKVNHNGSADDGRWFFCEGILHKLEPKTAPMVILTCIKPELKICKIAI